MNIIDLPDNILYNITWTKPEDVLDGKALFQITDEVGVLYKMVDGYGMKTISKR